MLEFTPFQKILHDRNIQVPPGYGSLAPSCAHLSAADKQELLEACLGEMPVALSEEMYLIRRFTEALMLEDTEIDDSPLLDYLDALSKERYPFTGFPIAAFVGWLEQTNRRRCLSVPLLTALRQHFPGLRRIAMDKNHRMLMRRYAVAVGLLADAVIPEAMDLWTAVALTRREAMDPAEQEGWDALLSLAVKQTSSTPTKSYLKAAPGLLASVPSFPEMMTAILEALANEGPMEDPWLGFPVPNNILLDTDFSGLLRALLHLCVPFYDLADVLREVAQVCLKKRRSIGPLSPKIAAACAWVLSQQKSPKSARNLFELQNAAKHRNTKKGIGKAIAGVSEVHGCSIEELEDATAPDLGFERKFPPSQQVEDQLVLLTMTAKGAPELVAAEGTLVKSKALVELRRELKRTWALEVKRLERLLRSGRAISGANWCTHFLHHPLVGRFCEHLLWQINDTCVFVQPPQADGSPKLQTICGNNITLQEDDQVRLWHPATLAETDRKAWEKWVLDNRFTQPFQQAQRNIYPLDSTLGETTDYRRFRGEYIHQGAFAALCRERGWHYSFHGEPSQFEPYIPFPEFHLLGKMLITEHLFVSAEGDTKVWLRVEAVSFHSLLASAAPHPMNLSEVPPIVRNETLRDVELFLAASMKENPGMTPSRDIV